MRRNKNKTEHFLAKIYPVLAHLCLERILLSLEVGLALLVLLPQLPDQQLCLLRLVG